MMILSRKKNIYICLFPLSFIFMGLGQPIFGSDKLALSNLYQILLFVLLVISVRQKVINYIYMSFFVLTSLLSILYAGYEYGIDGKPFVLVFMVVSLYCFFAGICFIRSNAFFLFKGIDDFYLSLRWAVVVCFVISLLLVFYQIHSGVSRITFGMDDKSHASIILCLLSFLSCRAFKRYWVFFVPAFFFLTLFSLSRLSFVFLPFIFIYYLYKVYKSDSFFLKGSTIFFLISSFFVFGYLYSEYPNLFAVIDRVSSVDAVKNNDSTSAHGLLISSGVDLKFDSVGNFIFGVSPGAFGETLVVSDVDYRDLYAVDPNFIEQAKIGKAPIHSTHLAMLVEYSIPVFFVYVFYNFFVLYRLLAYKMIYELMLYLPFAVSISFYSSHNKFYYFVFLLVIESAIQLKEFYYRPSFQKAECGSKPL